MGSAAFRRSPVDTDGENAATQTEQTRAETSRFISPSIAGRKYRKNAHSGLGVLATSHSLQTQDTLLRRDMSRMELGQSEVKSTRSMFCVTVAFVLDKRCS